MRIVCMVGSLILASISLEFSIKPGETLGEFAT